MKKFFLLLLFFIPAGLKAQEDVVPKKPSLAEGLVLDQAALLTPEQEASLEQKLVAYDRRTSNQIAIVIIPDLKGNSIDDVGLQIGRSWGIGGQAEKDNGVLILVSKRDRKVSIQVGYGLEGAISDNTALKIIDNEIAPNFRKEDYFRGLTQAVDKLIEAAEGRYTAPKGYGKSKGPGFAQIFFIIILVIIFLSIFGRNNRGGGYASRRGYRGWRGPVIWGSGGGWGSSGGGGGWSGGGGGFGGFGGGSFGGGGASGSW